MSSKIDFSVSSSAQIEAALCNQLEHIRLSRNVTQVQLAHEASVSPRTIRRLEKGEGVSLDTFIRVLMALGIQHTLDSVLPDPTVRPIERVAAAGRERKRARPRKADTDRETWSWGDGRSENG